MHVAPCLGDKKHYLPLLLLADPEEAAIDRYLPQGELWILWDDQVPIGAAVVTPVSAGICELKNLAIAADRQRQGCGAYLLRQLCQRYVAHCHTMLVGTTEAVLPFYTRLGFVYDHTERGFFTTHYAAPIWENGRQCVDMLYLKRGLR